MEDLLRELAPQVLAVLARRHDGFDLCEDAVQEALVAAAGQWPVDGTPANPTGWLITVASRRWIEFRRADVARRRREDAVTAARAPEGEAVPGTDDSLTLLFLCCHPALKPLSQVALTLRAVGGLTTSEIARALLVPDATVAQRISRAKQTIKASGAHFEMPEPEDRAERVAAVHRVLYLIFNEGYTASSGAALQRIDLSHEAIRLTRELLERLPADGESAGLLALMLLTDARRAARTTPDGAVVPLPEQDRSRWDRARIAEGTALIERTLATAPIGAYQVQAAIAAVHDEATSDAATDWPQILGLYDVLTVLAPSPIVALNRVVAVAMVRGAAAGLHALDGVTTDPTLAAHPRAAIVRAHLLEMAGDHEAAREQFRLAARITRNLAERRYLESRAIAAQ
ncbi:MAG: RNA polymerase sigma factor [Actinomycetota bacterium]|nr:RNA polymerase sigma factor [Actinomycetota bacterium]